MEKGLGFGKVWELFVGNNMYTQQVGPAPKRGAPGGGGCSAFVPVLFPFCPAHATLGSAGTGKPLIYHADLIDT